MVSTVTRVLAPLLSGRRSAAACQMSEGVLKCKLHLYVTGDVQWINLSFPRDHLGAEAEAEAEAEEAARVALTYQPANPSARPLVLADVGCIAKR